MTKKWFTKTKNSICSSTPSTSKTALKTRRYNRVVISTDADVDGMHIRLLLLTFFLQFFPDLVKQGHLYILDTPIVQGLRDKQKTFYCYNEKEKQEAIKN